jgi:hypothetical protein
MLSDDSKFSNNKQVADYDKARLDPDRFGKDTLSTLNVMPILIQGRQLWLNY